VQCFSSEEARRFCAAWLPAWSGNDPGRLASFYTEDVFYLDPGVPDGLQGKPALIRYLKILLGNNPEWAWQHLAGVPLEDGFLNKWQASIPTGDRVITCKGVCSVQLRNGLIYRNEVYFDRFELITAIEAWNREKQRWPAPAQNPDQ
jgi:SnoaL-like protein